MLPLHAYSTTERLYGKEKRNHCQRCSKELDVPEEHTGVFGSMGEVEQPHF